MKQVLYFAFLVLLAGAHGDPVESESPSSFTDEDGAGILGYWYTAQNETQLEIFLRDGLYCGRIVWLAAPYYPADDEEAFTARRDRENPDPELRSRPIIGLVFIEGLAYAGKNRYRGGTLYNPDNGKTYKCSVTLESSDELRLRGYIGLPALGRTETWRRAPQGEEHMLRTAGDL